MSKEVELVSRVIALECLMMFNRMETFINEVKKLQKGKLTISQVEGVPTLKSPEYIFKEELKKYGIKDEEEKRVIYFEVCDLLDTWVLFATDYNNLLKPFKKARKIFGKMLKEEAKNSNMPF